MNQRAAADQARSGVEAVLTNDFVDVLRVLVLPNSTVKVPAISKAFYNITKGGNTKVTWPADGKDELWSAVEGESGWQESEPEYLLENIDEVTIEFLLVQIK